MANPQCEDGYTKIANELLDAMCRLHLSGNQWKVLHAIIRKTYGWNRKADWISGSQIAELTSLHRSRVSEALKALQVRRVILRDGRLTGVQKDYSMWHNVTEIRNNDTPQNVTEIRTPVTQNRNKMLRKSRHTKDKRQYTKDSVVHPAVQIYDELTGKRTRRGTLRYNRIAKTVTDNDGKLSLWREVVEGWLLSEFKPGNVRGMLDWFLEGKISARRTSSEAIKQEQDDEMQRKLDEYHKSVKKRAGQFQ